VWGGLFHSHSNQLFVGRLDPEERLDHATAQIGEMSILDEESVNVGGSPCRGDLDGRNILEMLPVVDRPPEEETLSQKEVVKEPSYTIENLHVGPVETLPPMPPSTPPLKRRRSAVPTTPRKAIRKSTATTPNMKSPRRFTRECCTPRYLRPGDGSTDPSSHKPTCSRGHRMNSSRGHH
jgi:hypothetical protein